MPRLLLPNCNSLLSLMSDIIQPELRKHHYIKGILHKQKHEQTAVVPYTERAHSLCPCGQLFSVIFTPFLVNQKHNLFKIQLLYYSPLDLHRPVARSTRNRTTPITSRSLYAMMGIYYAIKTTPRSWDLLQKPPTVWPLKNLPIFYWTQSYITVFTGVLHWSVTSTRSTTIKAGVTLTDMTSFPTLM
jgi:hypothetical protein